MSQRFNSINLYIHRDENLQKNMILTHGTGNPDATLYIKQGQSLLMNFECANLSSCFEEYYIVAGDLSHIAFIINADYPFELFCKKLINGAEGEFYDCHHPDLVLHAYLKLV